jgi:hypothetical protein
MRIDEGARGDTIIFLTSLADVGHSSTGCLASLGLTRRIAEESEGERLWALGFPGMESAPGFDLQGSTRDRTIGMMGGD